MKQKPLTTHEYANALKRDQASKLILIWTIFVVTQIIFHFGSDLAQIIQRTPFTPVSAICYIVLVFGSLLRWVCVFVWIVATIMILIFRPIQVWFYDRMKAHKKIQIFLSRLMCPEFFGARKSFVEDVV